MAFSFVFYSQVRNTPKGSTYFKPRRSGGLEVTSRGDFYLYLVMNIPMYAGLALLTWKLSPTGIGLLDNQVCVGAYIGLGILFAFQTYKIYQVNEDVFTGEVPALHRYKFKQVAILSLAYLTTFGSELAVISMLPLFFLDTFSVSPVMAGMLASAFAFMNLVSRPFGGWFSDKFGRRNSLLITLAGLCVGYVAMSQITQAWAIPLVVVVIMFCSFFVQAGEGAVFAMVPLVRRSLTGQIAGMVGAYGNVGAIVFLAVLSFATPTIFFSVIALAAVATLITVFFLDEPEESMVEVLPDGTVQLIEVA
jgi:NNP family nitrate/nitrite transporter-like MFS transporter